MSPSKKKAAKSTAKKSRAKAKSAKPKKKAASKKKAKPAKTARKKTTAKKSAKAASKTRGKTTTTARKAAAKTTAKKAAKAPAKKAAPKKAATKTTAETISKKASKSPAQADTAKTKATTAATRDRARRKETRPPKRARARKPITPTGPRHPKFGYKWACFGCGAKFYDLGKEEPICPKCQTDQRERPPGDAKPIVETPKPKVVRPMAQLLDDEEPAVHREEETHATPVTPTRNEIFDEAERDDASLDIDDAEATDSAQEPPEIDVL